MLVRMQLRRLFLAVILLLAQAGDYALIVRQYGTDTLICAKSRETCEAARKAIANGYWPIAPKDTITSCTPSPQCFSYDSNTIKGFNR